MVMRRKSRQRAALIREVSVSDSTIDGVYLIG
jgi:hypothetical protein